MVIDFYKIMLGILAFIAGQAVLQFIFQPIKDFNKERGDTSYLLLFYQAKITNASNDKEAADELKQMGAALLSTMGQIPLYSLFAWTRLFGLPSKRDVRASVREINGIVHSLYSNNQHGNAPAQNLKALKIIGQRLNISTSYGE